MTTKLTSLSTAVAVSLLLTGIPAMAQRSGQKAGQQAAGRQQQQMVQQQQLVQMDQTMQRLNQLEEQASKLAQNMAQRAGQAGAGQLGARDQSMAQLCDSVASLARDMTKTMGGIHQNLRDPALAQDRKLQKDMDRLRLHVEDMAGPLEDALKTMDRIQGRLHAPENGN